MRPLRPLRNPNRGSTAASNSRHAPDVCGLRSNGVWGWRSDSFGFASGTTSKNHTSTFQQVSFGGLLGPNRFQLVTRWRCWYLDLKSTSSFEPPKRGDICTHVLVSGTSFQGACHVVVQVGTTKQTLPVLVPFLQAC